jgi:hypothetical protein
MRHLHAMLFDTRVHDKWSYEQLPFVQRIMNTVEMTSTGVTPAELILNNSIRLSNRILSPPGSVNPLSRVALSDTMDNWVARQHTLLTVARAHQLQSDSHLLVEYDPRITEYPVHSDVRRSNNMMTLTSKEHKQPRRILFKIFLDFSQPCLGWFSPQVLSE